MFRSQENTQLIWNLLSEQVKTPLNDSNKQFFNQKVQEIHQNSFQFNNIMEMNKQLIHVCNLEFNKLNLEHRENEIEDMKEGFKPKEIDFSDKSDQHYENIDVLINETMSKRERDLAEITKHFNTNLNEPLSGERKKIKIIEEIKPVVEKKVSFNLKATIPKMCIKINYTENGINKTMFCNLNKHFRLFFGNNKPQTNITTTIENMEIIHTF